MASGSGQGGLRAGFGEADITPVLGTQIAGDIGRPRPTESIRDPLYARAAMFEAGGRKVCLLVLDILAITHEWSDRIRDAAAERFGLDRRAVAVHVTQTHSAPSIGHCFCRDSNPILPPDLDWLRGGDRAYNPRALDGALAAIAQAHANLEPARLGLARGVDGRYAFNRRFAMRDGTACTHAHGGLENISHTEGPVDPEVAVVQVESVAGRVLGVLLHHTCHPTFGYPKRYISADWCGEWAAQVKARMQAGGRAGPDMVAMVVNGCCGNIAPYDHLSPGYRCDEATMGKGLAETALRVLERATCAEAEVVAFRSRRLPIALRAVPAEELARARRLLAEHPTPLWRKNEPDAVEWDWIYALSRVEVDEIRRAEKTFDYEIQTLRVGDLALTVLGGEPFVEAQLEIKRHSPARQTLVAHMSNGYVGYIPTARALATGGYETWTAGWSKLVPEALQTIQDMSVAELRAIFT